MKKETVTIPEATLDEDFAEAPLERKQVLSLMIIDRILRGSCTSVFSIKHTGLNPGMLKKHLRCESGIKSGWSIDHIKARSTHDIDSIDKANWFDNLQIIPTRLNSQKQAEEIHYYF